MCKSSLSFLRLFTTMLCLLVFFHASAQSTEDEHAIRALFVQKEQVATDAAYESDFYNELIREEDNGTQKLRFREKIKAVNSKLDQINNSLAKETNAKSIEKLEAKKQDLLLERSGYEVQDAPVLSYYTQARYDQDLSDMQSAYDDNGSVLQTIPVVDEAILELRHDAEKAIVTTSEIRANAFGVEDLIKRADAGREAFAIEALAVEQLEQALDILDKMELITQYSNTELERILEKKSTAVAHEVTAEVEPSMVAEVIIEEKEAETMTIATVTNEPVAERASAPAEETPSPTMIMVEKESSRNGNCRVNEISEAVFFTVQIGAFKKATNRSHLPAVGTVCFDDSRKDLLRYTSGQFSTMEEAVAHLQVIIEKGVADAFITAYARGERITVKEANEMLNSMSRL